ncbi:SDR family NAD(P)-dependent oxidoreductase [Kribbella sp. NPDC004536]|uniref:SDR family NAD(P)-dependent oxidoreductase n=1 Tax=Kribbella sp. NPDC004536 TaxID=3364106 RepID=UPI0036C67A4B
MTTGLTATEWSKDVLLRNKNAVVYGSAGAVGSEIARTFAREGARVFLTGRHRTALEPIAKEIAAAGGAVEIAEVDALDPEAVDSHLDTVPTVDVSFNAIGIPQTGVQGSLLGDLSLESFLLPLTTYTKAHFVTARAAARRMAAQQSGVILMHTAQAGRSAVPRLGGMGPTWAALEALTRQLSVEYGEYGVRAVCLITTGMEETPLIDEVFGIHADVYGVTKEQFASQVVQSGHRKRPTSLAELAEFAAFLASAKAAAMTGAIANLTGGIITD